MLGFLGHKLNHPDSSCQKQIEQHLRQFIFHMAQEARCYGAGNDLLKNFEEEPGPNTILHLNEVLAEQQKLYETALLEAQEAKKCLLRAQLTWPAGKDAFRDLLHAVDCMIRVFENLLKVNRIQIQPDLLEPNNMNKVKHLFYQNRGYSANADKYFEKGTAYLAERTGINIDELSIPMHLDSGRGQPD